MLMQSLSSHCPLWEKWPLFVTGIPRRHFSSRLEGCGVHLKDLPYIQNCIGRANGCMLEELEPFCDARCMDLGLPFSGGKMDIYLNCSSWITAVESFCLEPWNVSTFHHRYMYHRQSGLFYNCPIHSLKVSLREFANILSQNKHSEWIFCINSSTSLRKWSWCEKCKTMWPSFFSFATKCGKTSFSKVIFVLCL